MQMTSVPGDPSLHPTWPGLAPTEPERRARGPFSIGEIVQNAYRVDGILGVGGMGVVYAATDCNLPRRVALKAPLHAAFGPAIRNEAQAIAAIRHPSFTAIYHFGIHENVEFFAMERILGESLDQRLLTCAAAGCPLSIDEAVRLLIAVGEALAAAHRVSVAHRDLKAANILLSGSRTVLIDLGLFIPEPLVGPSNLAAGSIQSIAPEVVLGCVVRGGGPLIDIYALGALAYELLVGHAPFVGDSTPLVLAKHVCGEIPDPREERAEVPAPLAALVRNMLAKEPTDRPSSADTVVWQLRHIRGEHVRPSNLPPPSSVPPVSMTLPCPLYRGRDVA